MVIHLLALGRLGAEQGSAGIDEILSLLIQLPGNQEILLLRAHGGADALHIRISEELQDPHGLTVQGLHGAKQRGFLVQSFTAVGAEGCGDAQGGSLDEGVGGGIPGGVASCLKGGPQAAGGEGGGIGLALDQLLAGEIHDHAAVGSGGNKAVMLLGSDSGEGLEPVGVVGCSVGNRPVLHGGSHSIGNAGLQLRAVIDGLLQGLVHSGAELRLHNPVVKYQTAKIIGYTTHTRQLLWMKIKKRRRRLRAYCSKTPSPLQEAFYTRESHLSTPCTKKVFWFGQIDNCHLFAYNVAIEQRRSWLGQLCPHHGRLLLFREG